MRSQPISRLLNRLLHEWAKNDGKLWEEWAPGRDLKEIVLTVALVICTILMAVAVIMQVVS